MTGGYISEEAKRKFSIRIGIWGVVFFLGQIIIPMAFMMLMFVPFFFFTATSMETYDLDNAAPYRDGILAAVRSSYNDQYALVYETADSSEKILSVAEKPIIRYGNGDIWCFTRPYLYHWSDGEWTTITNDMHWDTIVDIKAIENGMIVWQQTPQGTNQYMSYFEDSWIYLPQMISEWIPNEKHVRFRDNTYRFQWHEDALYSQVNATGEWTAVGCTDKTRWQVESYHDTVYVFQPGINYESPARVWLLADGEWQEQNIPGFPVRTRSMLMLNRTNELIIVNSYGINTPVWYRFDGNQCERLSGGEEFPFPAGVFFALMFVPHVIQVCIPLLFAYIVTVYIRKYRVKEYITELGSVSYAPVIRRAFAEIIDMLLVVFPMIVLFIVLIASGAVLSSLDQPPNEMIFLPLFMFGAMGGLCCYGLGMLFVYSFLEGHYGATPGKWLLKIRVVSTETLQPCGFGRALLRNLLRFVDGFFNYLVGILIVAFTEQQQRVGDLAARTIVIRAGTGDGIIR